MGFNHEIALVLIFENANGELYLVDQSGIPFGGTQGKAIAEGLNRYYSARSAEYLDELRRHDIQAQQQYVDERHELQKASKPTISPGFIYLIKAPTGYYKIGRTKDINRRLKELNRPGWTLELIHLLETNHAYRAERRLHEKYAQYLIDSEWFALDELHVNEIKVLQYIEIEGLQS